MRLAEKLAQALSTLMRLAESMVTPETECLLYATYWFRPILSELLDTSCESAALNRNRAPSGPVKVLVTDRQPKCLQSVVDVCSGASSLLAWFPTSWASKIAPEFLANPLKTGARRRYRNLLALSELVWMMMSNSTSCRRLDSQPETCLSLTLTSTGRSEMATSLRSSSKATPRTW